MKTATQIQEKLIHEYWRNRLSSVSPVSTKYRLADKATGVVSLEINTAITERIKRICNGNPLAEFTFLMSGWMLLVKKYFDLSELTVATGDICHAQQPGRENHLLFCKLDAFNDITAREFIKEVGQEVQQALRYGQFEVEDLQLQLNTDQLCEVSFAFDATTRPSVYLEQSALSLRTDGKTASLHFNTTLYTHAFSLQLLKHYVNMLEQLYSTPDKSIHNISLLTQQEQQAMLEHPGNVNINASLGDNAVAVFESMAERFPDHKAVVFGSKTWTYRALNEKSNQLAHYLRREYALSLEEPVGLMVTSSDWLIVGMLGILKAGGAYVPIEPSMPKQRRAHVLNDTALKVIITEFDMLFSISDYQGSLFAIDVQADSLDTPVDNPAVAITGERPAYIIYTSGTTGLPKGVVIEHRSLVNYADWFVRAFGINENDSAVLTSSYAFDLGYTNIWGALLGGACLHLLAIDVKKAAGEILHYLVKHNISFIKTTPSLFYMLLRHPDFNILVAQLQLRLILLGGEPINAGDVADYLKHHPATTVANHYGPTETTVGTVAHIINDIEQYAKQPVIGSPIYNAKAYILDQAFNLLPDGVNGELCIAGGGLGRGYLNQPELTHEKFIYNPHNPQERLYRTGDVACRNINANTIVLSGRRDSQVKVRGYRIELGEIVNALKQHKKIDQAAVKVKKDDNGNNTLIAYYTSKEQQEVNGLQSFFADYLPDYMIPAHTVFMKSMPVTSNGKIDMQALPDPAVEVEASYEPPVTSVQQQLAAIWKQVLGVRRVGLKDNFFELGGHSLKATQLLTEIHVKLNAHIDLTHIFDYPVLETLANHIESSAQKAYHAILAQEEQEHYLISHAQKRLWVIEQFHKADGAYNVHNSFRLEQLDRAAFNAAVTALLQRHEILRTAFFMSDGEPRQRVYAMDALDFQIKFIDLRTATDLEAAVALEVKKERAAGFDIEKAPLIRIVLLQLEDEVYQAEMNIHHIVSDGWSKEVLFREFNELYMHYTNGAPLTYQPDIQYRDYAIWQHRCMINGEWNVHKAYWHERFAGNVPLLELFTDFKRPAMRTFNGKGISFLLPKDIIDVLHASCKEHGCTLFMGLLSVVKLLLHRYTKQEDIVIGTGVAGRNLKELEGQLGFYINTLPLRTTINGNEGFSSLLGNVRDTTLNAFANQQYPYNLLVDDLKLDTQMNRNPLFDVMVLLQNMAEAEEYEALSGESELGFTPGEASKFDLTFTFRETTNGVLAHINYNTDLFAESRIVQMIGHLRSLLIAASAEPARAVSTLEYLSGDEQHELLDELNDTAVGYPEDKTIVSLFEEQAARTPGNIAVTFGTARLTYKELNERSNQLAHCLRTEHNIGREDLVGLMTHRSELMIIGIMGILKAGAAYVPIDPEYPEERREYIKKDSGIKFIVTEAIIAASTDQPVVNPTHINVSTDLAYAIYTSGSSGLPKGVLIEHYNVIRLLFNDAFQFSFSDKDVWTVFHSICFDFSVWEIFGSLLYGARLVVVPRKTAQSAAAFADLLLEEQVTVLNQVPGIFNNLSAEILAAKDNYKNLALRYVIFAGEALNPASLKGFHERYGSTKLINMYGITETTVHTTFREIGEKEIACGDSNIGWALPTVSLYLVDEQLQLVPKGVAGEILVGGKAVARGYLNRPELTAEKFVSIADFRFQIGDSNAKSEIANLKSEILYRSGDLGVMTQERELIYLGRKDFQVKIRGYRIELGEIEDALIRYEGINDAVVIARKDEHGEYYLAGYYVSQSVNDASTLSGWLQQRLPGYMVPSFLVHMEAFPVTANGKVDRRALPEPAASFAGRVYEAPATTFETRLAAIWKEVLKKERISATDNFFEIGGQSLKAMQVLGKVYQHFNVQLSLNDIFDKWVLRDLAAVIAQSVPFRHQEIPCIEEQEHYPLSNAQHRLWVIEQFEEARGVYNIPYHLTFTSLDVDAFKRALEKIVARHEILRTSFIQVDGEPRQRIQDASAGFSLDYIDLRNEAEQKQELIRHKREAETFAFDLASGPLIRVTLLQLKDQLYKTIINLHHIISDGWSREVLEREFTEIYENLIEQMPLKLQYKDYAAWQRTMSSNNAWNDDRAYWHRHLSNLPLLELPTDYPRPARRTYEGARASILLGELLSTEIISLCEREGVTLFMGLLACTNVLLYKYSGAEDMVIGTPVAGRDRPELEGQLGFYVNTLPLRSTFSAAGDFTSLLAHVRQVTLEAYKRQQYPFDLLVNELQQTWSINRSPVFDVMMDIQNFRKKQVHGVPQANEPYSFEQAAVKFDLSFSFAETSAGILLSISYNKALFAEGTIREMISHFINAMQSVVNDPAQPISAQGVLDVAQNNLRAMENALLSHPSIASAAIIEHQEKTVAWYVQKQELSAATEETAPLSCRATTSELALINRTNETAYSYDELLPVHCSFEQSAAANATRTALVCGDTKLTYQELNEQANQLAHFINSRYKVKKQDAIGLLAARSEQMIVGMLAILKLGAVYVPIDADYPAERINYILDEAAVKLLLTTNPFNAASSKCPQVVLSGLHEQLEEFRNDDLEITPPLSRPAYIMFTSGTTGKPKGVVISHESFADYVESFSAYFNIGKNDVVIQQASVSFDTSIEEIFPVLCRGGQLVILPGGGRDIDSLVANAITHSVTILSTTPLVINEINVHEDRAKMKLRALITGGDKLKASHINNLIQETTVYNTYGPTESTVCATYAKVNDLSTCNVIGHPLRNRQVYLLNADMEEVGIGMQGEIYIGGKGLAKEYLNRPDETQSAFVQHPVHAGIRLYKTGDIGRRMADGSISFTGRKDSQLKVRGYRVELAEVEHHIASVNGVDSAVVAARLDKAGNHELIAWYTSAASTDKNEVWRQLNELLPIYMVPAHILRVEKFPVTSNGKTDVGQLPYPAEQVENDALTIELKQLLTNRFGAEVLPALFIRTDKMPVNAKGEADRGKLQKMTAASISEAQYQPAGNELEGILVDIWKDVLGGERIGVTDHFFELGGNSIKATRIISRIRKRLNKNITPGMFFDEPTIRGLAGILQQQDNGPQAAEKIIVSKHYPVSFAQRRLWVIEQFAEAQGAYNMPSTFEFEELSIPAFEKAIAALTRRHEILRTTFDMVEGEPVQKVWDPGELIIPINYTDVRGHSDPKAAAKELIAADSRASFNLATGPLLRISLMQLSEERFLVLFNQHHIISDGWSMTVIEREFNDLYTKFERGEQPSGELLSYQYKDYTLWQLQQFRDGHWDKHRNYWHKQMSGMLPVLELPADRPRPVSKRYEGAEVNVVINRQVRNAFEKLCRENQATLFMGFLAVTNILLHRYSGQDDIIIGSPIAGRNRLELEDQLGCYANTLALRTQLSGNDSLRTVFDKVRDVTLGAFEHQQYPFDLLVDELGLERDVSRMPLFDVMLLVQAQKALIKDDERLTVSRGKVCKFDLTINFTDSPGGMGASIVFSTALFNEERMKRMATHLRELITKMVQFSGSIKDIDYITAVEKKQVAAFVQGSRFEYPFHQTIHGLVVEQAEKSPHAIAVKSGDRHLTYRELNEQSGRFANYLKTYHGIGKGDLAGVMVTRNEMLPVVLLGVLKAGAAYLPLDPAYPEARLQFMKEDANVKTVVVDDTLLDERIQQCSHETMNVNEATDRAYLIYTSGTTGKPKGVSLSHRNAVALMSWGKREFAATPVDTVFATTSYCFDLSVYELFYTLAAGKQLRVLQNALELPEWITKEKNILVNTVPSVVNSLLDQGIDLSNIKALNIAGEPIPATVIDRLDTSGIEVRNLYGPSEYATYSTGYLFPANDKTVLIGRPLHNTGIYILDGHLQQLPIGIKGEIFVSGEHLADGYLNRPELTQERFIPHPFEAGKKLYRTGDLGWWREDGNIECIGRKDNQVKLRGFRIELGEIDALMSSCPQVKQAVAVVRKLEDGDQQLAAYYTGEENAAEEIKNYLRAKLPQYMVPSFIVHMTAFPLSPNGKVDRNKLPAPDGVSTARSITTPRTDMESTLLDIWKEVLNKNELGVRDDFFEAGGQSIKAMQLVSRVYHKLGVTISFSDIFRYPTVEGLASRLDEPVTTDQSATSNIQSPAIQPVPNSDHYPVSFAQRRLWVIDQFQEAAGVYNMPYLFEFEELDKAVFEKALFLLIDRHEILRTAFPIVDGEPVQKVRTASEARVNVIYTDLRGVENAGTKAWQLNKQHATQKFDLVNGPLLSVEVREMDRKSLVSLNLHHIISDGWSMDVIKKDFTGIYNRIKAGEEMPAPLAIQYKDYTVWQLQQQKDGAWDRHRQYWKRQFEDEQPVLQLPADNPRPAVKRYEGSEAAFTINTATFTALQQLCREEGVTIFMALLAATKTLLYRYTGQNDITIGSAISGRGQIELEDQIGFYVNTLALRSRFSSQDSLRSILQKIKEVTLQAHEHQQYPFDVLVDELGLQRDMSRTPLFDVLMMLEAVTDRFIETDEITVRHGTVCKFDLTFAFLEAAEGITVRICYSSHLYSDVRMIRMAAHFRQLLSAMVEQPEVPVSTINYLSAQEKEALLVKPNLTSVAYPDQCSIPWLFERQASKIPFATAASFNGQPLTYKSLSVESDRLAWELIHTHAVQHGDIVALMAERSLEMIITMLAILKAGAAYLPIDPQYPPERMQFMLEDANIRVIITQPPYQTLCKHDSAAILLINDLLTAARQQPHQPLNRNVGPNDAAYVMYTSGSTGKPKGVVVTHRNIIRLVKNTNCMTFTPHDCVLQTGSLSFDASTFEFYAMLLNGGEVCMLPVADLMNPDVFKATLLSGRISILWIATSWLNQLVEQDPRIFAKLRCVVTGGEKVSAQHLNKLSAAHPRLQIINAYGPTENAVFSLCKTIDKHYANDVPLGKPVSNSTVYILDDHQLPVPEGITGELYVGGDGLAAGYLNRPELTAERFLELSGEWLMGNGDTSKIRLYRTGDLGCWRENGDIDFLGRRDGQVKVRGFRIELGEIDAQLSACPQVQQPITIVHRNADGDQHLVTYYTGEAHAGDAIRQFLAGRLPQYMVPSYFVHMSAFPVTPNGKIDLKKLPAPDTTAAIHEFKAPRTETEKVLLEIWKEVLKRDAIGITDNFFEAGGQSIKAMQVVSRAFHKSGLSISFRDIFRLPTIESLAAFLEPEAAKLPSTSNFQPPTIDIAPQREYYPVSFAQRRLWVIEQFQEASGAYNMPFVFDLYELDRDAFDKAMNALIERHEILRTVFPMVNSEPVQRVIPMAEMNFRVIYEDLRGEANAQRVASRRVRDELFYSFDLVRGPLIRAKLLHLEDARYCLVFNQHHIISDGWSMNILQNEFMELYDSIRENREHTLAPLSMQYKDYTLWQLEQLEQGEWNGHRKYWMDQFAEDIPTLEMPTDRPRPAKKTYDGFSTNFVLGKQMADQLEQLCKKQGCTLFMGLMAAVNVLLNRYTGQSDITIGSPITGRDNLELENQLGFYVNTLPLRTRFSSNSTFASLLQKVRNVTLGAYEHQQYPFDLLVNELGLERDMSRNPLFDVMLSLQNLDDDSQDRPVTEGEFSDMRTKFDLMYTFISSANGIVVNIRYNRNLFDKERIMRMIGHFRNILAWALQHADQPLAETNWLSAAEKETLLVTFNNTAKYYPRDKTIHQLFEEQVARTPDAAALVYEDKTLSYHALNARANQLAHYLRTKHQVKAGSPVALMMDRSIDLVVGMLGILKSGGAYVPVDPMYPEKRRQYMIDDSRATVVLSQLEGLDLLDYPVHNPAHVNTSSDLIYIIYTSGSTGEPKGVCIKHSAVVNLVQWLTEMVYLPHGKPITTLLTASVSFDASVKQLFPPLLCGSKLLMIPEKIRTNPKLYADELEKQQVELLDITPSYLQMVLKEISSRDNFSAPLRYVLAGGEVLQKETALLFHEQFGDAAKLINVYGPTEATVDATSKIVTGEDVTGIGHPISNARIYILDNARKPVAIGVPGELCIGGDGLAIGYCNRPELTAEKFVTVSGEWLGVSGGEEKVRLYLTGDLACWKEDGSIDYLGRRDEQVKLRGYRIELSEIEAALAGHENIDQAVVVLRNMEDGEKQLVAYYTGTEASPDHIRNYLSRLLPQHMLPACLVYMVGMPLTANGKVDRKKLPDPGITTRREIAVPRTATETKLLRIWQEVLEKQDIGIEDNFFEIGGHSLKAMQIVSRMNMDMKLDISIREIFNYPTIEKLAAVAEGDADTAGLLVELNTIQEGNLNAFFIPPVLGFSTIYRNLASKLEGSINCYGLQYKGSDGSSAYDYSIEAMANTFLQEILRVDSDREVVITGYSMGALIAFELTKLLEQQGYRVRLVLLDKNVKALEYQLSDLADEKRLDAYFEQEIKPWLALVEKKDIHHFRHFFRHNLAVSNKYVFNGSVNADILAMEARNGRVRTGMEHWKDLTSGDFRHLYAEGAHSDMLKEENLAGIIEYINLSVCQTV